MMPLRKKFCTPGERNVKLGGSISRGARQRVSRPLGTWEDHVNPFRLQMLGAQWRWGSGEGISHRFAFIAEVAITRYILYSQDWNNDDNETI